MIKNYWRYYRNSLADSDRMMPDDGTLAQSLSITIDELLEGKISEERMRQLTQGRWNSHDPDEQGRISLQIAPWIGKVKPEHGVQKNGLPTWIAPLWLPVKLLSSGVLLPDEQRKPWIPRNLLEPIHPARLVLGSVQDLDHFLTVSTFNLRTIAQGETDVEYACYALKEWLKYGQMMINFVSKIEWDTGVWPLQEYIPEKNARIMIQPRPSAAVIGLLNIYDRTIRDQRYPKSLEYFFADDTKDEMVTIIDEIQGAKKHIATWPNNQPLSPSQRKALHHNLSRNTEVQGVNGPPGTGKTTLIAMLLLQKWADAALHKKEEPPIFLLAAANNQALHTLLSASMKEIEKHRWINTFSGAGLLCLPPSRIDAVKAEKTPWTSWIDGGVLKVWSSEEFVQNAQERYLNEAYEAFKTNNVVDTLEAISRQLNKVKILQETIEDQLHLVKLDGQISHWELKNNDKKLLNVLEEIKTTYTKKEKNIRFVKNLRKAWADFNETSQVWTWLLQNVPGGDSTLEKRNRKFFEKVGFVPKIKLDSISRIDNFLKKLSDAVQDEFKKIQNEYEECDYLITEKRNIEERQNERYKKYPWSHVPLDSKEKMKWELRMDQEIRAETAKWTIRYWEGVWLLRMADRWARGGQLWTQDPLDMKHKWETWGCITPFLGSTVYTAPRFFLGWQGEDIPLYDLFDTIVIDEAAQVVPEAGIGIFPLGKNVILAGDPEQLEPLWGVPERTDVGNAIHYGVIQRPDQWATWKQKALSASSGNLMKRIQMFQDKPLWLEEQHRSHPDLVKFANKLCYKDALKATREVNDSAFGFIHVNGSTEMWYGSRFNVPEAEVIATFVHENIQEWRKKYPGLEDEKIVGVITPFVKQTHIIKEKLQEQGVNNITVGTVHAFQGSERPIIIFSPVEQLVNDDKVAFFNQDRKFLNVTVSRARDRFYIVGNLNGWTPNGLSPASVLAQSICSIKNMKTSNWIPEIMGHGLQSDGYIYGADYAEEWIVRLIDEADRYPVHIASPVVDPDYMEYIGLFEACRRANNRGVEVIIYANKPLMLSMGQHGNISTAMKNWEDAGGTWYWKDSLWDSRIWNGLHLAEANHPWLMTWQDGSFRMYDGEALSWTERQVRQWGSSLELKK